MSDPDQQLDERKRAAELAAALAVIGITGIGVLGIAAFADHLTGLHLLAQAANWIKETMQ